jgi:hypothetical protein
VEEQTTIALTLWKGWRPLYDSRHVNAIVRMVAEHSPNLRVICFTNMPKGIECPTWPLQKSPRLPLRRGYDCYRRLWFFSRQCARLFPGTIVNLDLDSLIVRPLEPLMTGEDVKFMYGGSGPYNGSFWIHRTGTRTELWDDLNPRNVMQMYKDLARDKKTRRWVGSDQRWFGYKLKGEAVYTQDEGLYYGHINRTPPPDHYHARMDQFFAEGRIAFFPGGRDVKPWSEKMAEHSPRVHEQYMRYFNG